MKHNVAYPLKRPFVAVMAVLLAICIAGIFTTAGAAEGAATVGEGEQLVVGSAVDDATGMGVNDFKRLNKGTARSYKGVDWGYRFPVNDDDAFIAIALDGGVIYMIPQSAADAVSFDPSDADKMDALQRMVFELDSVFSDGGTRLETLDVPSTFSVGEQSVVIDGTTISRDVEIGDGRLYVTVVRSDGQPNKTGIVCCDYGHLVTTDVVAVENIPTLWENLASFLQGIDYRPLWVSLKTSFTALVIVFVLGLLAAWKSIGVKSRWKGVVDTLFTIPMVLPPTVCGFLLLLLFGNASGLGRWLMAHGVKLVFSWPATVIAAIVVAFPLMYRTARGAFEALDANMLDAARTLGWSERRIFFRLMVPLAWPSIAAGTVLAFARAMGEFGATLFCAGNYAGITQTMPIAIYFSWMGGQTDVALFWVAVVILISFIVILVINLYSAHSQRYRQGGLTRKERRMLKEGDATFNDKIGDDQAFLEVATEDVRAMLQESAPMVSGSADKGAKR